MSRRRAGNGWTVMCVGPTRRMVHLIANDAGQWITTGFAKDWPRCKRCRGPHETSPFNSGLCPVCYFYHIIEVDEFWRLHNEGYYLAPYNIGRRSMNNPFGRPTTLKEARPSSTTSRINDQCSPDEKK